MEIDNESLHVDIRKLAVEMALEEAVRKENYEMACIFRDWLILLNGEDLIKKIIEA